MYEVLSKLVGPQILNQIKPKHRRHLMLCCFWPIAGSSCTPDLLFLSIQRQMHCSDEKWTCNHDSDCVTLLCCALLAFLLGACMQSWVQVPLPRMCDPDVLSSAGPTSPCRASWQAL